MGSQNKDGMNFEKGDNDISEEVCCAVYRTHGGATSLKL
jgi:hypothetical protein